jgi:opacity protein-like surface antigen
VTKNFSRYFLTISICSLSALANAEDKRFSGLGLGAGIGYSTGTHSIDLEIGKYKVPIVSDGLDGGSFNLSVDYLFTLGDWRVGPRLTLGKASFKANDFLGNKYANLQTSLKLDEFHSLGLMAGTVISRKWMPYVFLGIGVGYGDISGKASVLKYSAASSSSGYVAGPMFGLGVKYYLSNGLELGLEFSQANFGKTYSRCLEDIICARVPVRITPKQVSFTLTKRF